jgi:type IV secretory pathway VirB4 component
MEFFSLQTLSAWVIAGGAAYFGAYVAAKGKNLARKEDLDGLVAEVRAVTIVQKEIEAKISDKVWERQWRLDQKRDNYSQMLRAISDYMVRLLDLAEGAQLGTGNTTTKQFAQIAEEFYAAYAVSALFLRDESIAIVEKIRPKFFYHSSLDFEQDQHGAIAQEAYGHLAEARKELIASARKDLAG